MVSPSAIGLLSTIIVMVVPVSMVFLLIWVYQIKRNSETQVTQNKEIIQLLEKGKMLWAFCLKIILTNIEDSLIIWKP